MSIKEEFKTWLKTKVETQAPLSSYPNALENFIPNELNNRGEGEYNDLFECNDIAYLEKLYERLSRNGDLYEFNGTIQNGISSAAVNKFMDFLKFKKVLHEMKKYDKNSNLFDLNNAHIFFTVKEKSNKYPIKAICKNIYKELDLASDYTTNCAKSKLRQLFGTHNINFIDIKEDSNYKIEKATKMKTKNIMLYGAPGVGKTHNYKKLVSLIEGGDFKEKEIFDFIINNKDDEIEENSVEELYQNVKNENRIEFVTFHQSYSYEDFIEGFRPNENSNIELEDGIFKNMCKKASNQVKETTLKRITFDEAYDTLRTEYLENELDKIYSVSNIEIIIHEFKEKTIKVQSSKAKDHQYVKKSDLETVVEALLKKKLTKPSDIKSLDVKKDTISLAGLYYPIGNKIVKIIEETRNIVEEKEKNFYIVIDEINRGNISKIFGELITLIEENKRDIYEVTLPYSKEKFRIPSNIYIIATMNSTDKSIATIDIALRRRFTFLKMKPNSELVKSEDAKQLMKELNQYISKSSLGEDYQLGHSYFMGDDIDLGFVIDYKIKPLLEEYFYADEKTPNQILELARNEYKD